MEESTGKNLIGKIEVWGEGGVRKEGWDRERERGRERGGEERRKSVDEENEMIGFINFFAGTGFLFSASLAAITVLVPTMRAVRQSATGLSTPQWRRRGREEAM